MWFMDEMFNESVEDTTEDTEKVELESIMDELDNLPIIECTEEDPFSAFLKVTCENQINFNNIMNAIAMDELNYLKENGEELVIEAESEEGKSRVKSVINRVLSALDALWQKIVGVVKDVLLRIDSWAKEDKKFLDAHREEINKVTGHEAINMKGYDFDAKLITGTETYTKVEAFAGKVIEATKEDVDKFRNNKASDFKAICKDISGEECESINKFRKAMFKYYRSGKDKVEFKTIPNKDVVIRTIRDTSETKKKINEAYKGSKNAIAKMKKIAKDLDKSVKNTNDKKSEYRTVASAAFEIKVNRISTASSLISVIVQEQIKAATQYNRMCKAMIVRAISKSSDSSSKGELRTVTSESGTFNSYLDRIEIV